ncbi:hypothetical protein RU97_GL002068 [Enterococcus canis]|uniref:Mga helix-turn-helix domain-containing protein n=2 Tax=Enterococcus canis TaxID=214095 RepID=A0A1L8RE76_9ENTE|nr:hypothetical protein RU97_GL002068 [Enterococcus canis]
MMSMEELLTATTKRQLKLLEIMNREQRWLTAAEITRLLDCSLKTLQSDLRFFGEQWSEYFTVEVSKQKGLRLVLSNKNKIGNLYRQVIHQNDAFTFMEELFFEPNQDSDYWQRHCYLSEASFYRMVNKVEKALARRGLQLERNPFRITATDERRVRMFFAYYFMEKNQLHDWPFPFDRQRMLCLVMRSLTDFEWTLDDAQILKLSYLFAITIIRRNQGFALKESYFQEPLDVLEQILLNNTAAVKAIVALGQQELPQFWVKEASQTVFYQFYIWDNPEEELRIQRQIAQALHKAATVADIPIKITDVESISDRLMDLYGKFKAYPYPHFVLMDKYAYTTQGIYTNYPVMCAILEKVLYQLEKQTNFPWYSEFRYRCIYWIFIKWDRLPLLAEAKRRKAHILIASDLGYEHAQLLADMIEGTFQQRVIVAVNQESLLFFNQEELRKFEDYDMIVVNNPMSIFPEEKQLVVENIPTIRNWIELEDQIMAFQRVPLGMIDFLKEWSQYGAVETTNH